MPNIAAVLKDEISRIARKEVRAETESLKKQITKFRSQIASLKRQVAGLEKVLRNHAPSDRGSQYVSIRYTERLAQAGIEPSVGSKGDSYDNALAETINGLYKAELIHRRAPWRTKASVELATLQWVSWFNHHRLLEPIGYIPPAEAEANYYRQLANQASMVVA